MSNSIPDGYLKCDGTWYDINGTYSNLAEFIKTEFGSYDYFKLENETTQEGKFKVPDLQGEFLRGTGTNNHTNQGSGANVGEHKDATEIPRSYAGNGTSKQIGISNTDGRWDYQLNSQNLDSITKQNNKMVFTTGTEFSNNGATGTVRPTNTSVLYCIKY